MIGPTVHELWSLGGGYLAPWLHTGPVFLDSVLLTGPSCRAGQTRFLLQFQWQDLNPTLFPTWLRIRSPFLELTSWAQINSVLNSSLKVPGASARLSPVGPRISKSQHLTRLAMLTQTTGTAVAFMFPTSFFSSFRNIY